MTNTEETETTPTFTVESRKDGTFDVMRAGYLGSRSLVETFHSEAIAQAVAENLQSAVSADRVFKETYGNLA